jgi:hypothetical protein
MHGYWVEQGPTCVSQYRSLFRRQALTPLQVPAGANLEQSLYILIPHWLLVVLTMPLPTYWFLKLHRSARRARRVRSGLCLVCGYDLRATPDRCPECGTVARGRAEG